MSKRYKNEFLLTGFILILCIFCPKAYSASDTGIHKIKHVIIIMLENRSFDHYFGTYPGAEGIPMNNGVPAVCCPDPLTNQCVKPYHDPNDRNFGGPHGWYPSRVVIAGGKMDSFIKEFRRTKEIYPQKCRAKKVPDVMGYHDRREIPNYWKYADEFVLQDHMFEPVGSWSLPAHLFMVSAWSATCSSSNPMSCVNDNEVRDPAKLRKEGKEPIYAWTDVTYLLHKKNIDWAYYLDEGAQIGEDSLGANLQNKQKKFFPDTWNPLPSFVTVRENKESDHIRPLSDFFTAAKSGNLPEVIWINPHQMHSEHPPSLVSDGQAFVTTIVNAVMRSPCWNSSAIFITWDDWGGFYDHLMPPRVDENGYGLRVPGLVISPYAKKGYIDHQVLSFDAYLKFIEDIFLEGQRINPNNDGRPDPRPTVREDVKILGDLSRDFDFNQEPRPPVILPPYPHGIKHNIHANEDIDLASENQ